MENKVKENTESMANDLIEDNQTKSAKCVPVEEPQDQTKPTEEEAENKQLSEKVFPTSF